MRTIELTQGYVALIDDIDLERVSGLRWRARVSAQGRRQPRVEALAKGPRAADGKHSTILMSRFIAGAGPGQIVDHRNGDPLDNRRSNLRLTDMYGNARNRRRRGGDDLPKGVSRSRHKGRYMVRLGRNGSVFQKYCQTLEEAQAVAEQESLRLYGDFAFAARR